MYTYEAFPVYVDIGANAGDTATINVNIDGTMAGSRTWDIKVTQVRARRSKYSSPI